MPNILSINVIDLLQARGVESARLEFKAAWNPASVGLQVLHTVCAFANDLQNLNGGYIVIGVQAHDGVAQLPPVGIAPSRLDEIQRWIRGRCNTIDPVYQPVLSPEVVDNRHILVIWAPGSDSRPHQASESLLKRLSASRSEIRHALEQAQRLAPNETRFVDEIARLDSGS